MIYIHRFLPHYDHSFVTKYYEILKTNRIEFQIVDSHDSDFWSKIEKTDFFIMFFGQTPMHLQRQIALISTFEKYIGCECFPNWNMSWHFDDKVAQQYLLSSKGFPVIPGHVFWDKNIALEWTEKAKYPHVFKLKGGAGSLNVIKVENKEEATKLINKMFSKGIVNGRIPGVDLKTVFRKNRTTLLKSHIKKIFFDLGLRHSVLENWSRQQGYAYFQDFLPDNKYDTRITVIGDKAFGFIRYNRPNDFRSSGSGKLDFSPKNTDPRALEIAFKISKAFSFKTMAYDFLIDKDGSPLINEMCCQFSDWAIYKCPGYWDQDLNWHEGHYWPQYLQLCDLLGTQKLIQPNFKLSSKSSQLIKVNN